MYIGDIGPLIKQLTRTRDCGLRCEWEFGEVFTESSGGLIADTKDYYSRFLQPISRGPSGPL